MSEYADRYMIKSTVEPDQWWHANNGWTDEMNASEFTTEERATTKMPSNGEWFRSSPTCWGMDNPNA